MSKLHHIFPHSVPSKLAADLPQTTPLNQTLPPHLTNLYPIHRKPLNPLLHIIHILPLQLEIIIHLHSHPPNIFQHLIHQILFTIKYFIRPIHEMKFDRGSIRSGKDVCVDFEFGVSATVALDVYLAEEFAGRSRSRVEWIERNINISDILHEL
mmetsp:Transcript_10022/g.21043  ORF Transcript_10022/g.21043 Transcript_10022/m.21043 type:complete len:154 (-) Transcript_10022:432-893(-)